MTINSNEKPGCLQTILNLIGGKREVQQAAPSVETTIEELDEALPYRLRDDFLTPSELSFYKIITQMLGKEWVVQSKVRLADLFFVSRPNENVRYFNKITAKHVDFLVCDAVSMKPSLGIELDDISHHKPERIERDVFVDKVFQAANLPLLHVANQRSYSASEIEVLISPLIDMKTIPVNSNPEVSLSLSAQTEKNGQRSPSSVPICPKCGIPMVVRTVSQGKHKGEKFFGCSNFPRCREMKTDNNENLSLFF
ncbi:MAG: DUF2726 domain-containing protein [Anaerolineaceae bacterium]|jgi:hypothetical protein